MTKRWTIAGGVGALLAAALVGGTLIGSVLGRGASTDADAGPKTDAERVAFDIHGMGGEYCEVFLDAFASELGVDRAGLIEAGRAAANAALDAAVDAGDVSERRAAAFREKIADADIDICARAGERGAGDGRHRGGMPPLGLLNELGDAAAESLGLERAELFDRLRDGESLSEIAQAQGIDYAVVTAAVLDAARAQLDEQVAEGRLTQQRADRALDQVSEFLEDGGSLRFGRDDD